MCVCRPKIRHLWGLTVKVEKSVLPEFPNLHLSITSCQTEVELLKQIPMIQKFSTRKRNPSRSGTVAFGA